MRLVSDILDRTDDVLDGYGLRWFAGDAFAEGALRGIAMGLVISDNGKYAVMSHVAGAEPSTATWTSKLPELARRLQMDIKVSGIRAPMMREALAQAKKARLAVSLRHHGRDADEARTAISAYAPRCFKLSIPTDKIRDLIGPGRKKMIIEATGVKIDVHDGTVHIFATGGAQRDAALQMVRDVTASAEIGKTYLGKVVRLANSAHSSNFSRHRRLAAHQRNFRTSSCATSATN